MLSTTGQRSGKTATSTAVHRGEYQKQHIVAKGSEAFKVQDASETLRTGHKYITANVKVMPVRNWSTFLGRQGNMELQGVKRWAPELECLVESWHSIQ